MQNASFLYNESFYKIYDINRYRTIGARGNSNLHTSGNDSYPEPFDSNNKVSIKCAENGYLPCARKSQRPSKVAFGTIIPIMSQIINEGSIQNRSPVVGIDNLTVSPGEDQRHIIDHTPLIRWDPYHRNDLRQQSYQLQISTDSSYNKIDIWDTNERMSSRSSIIYTGTQLEDGQTYYLRLRIRAGNDYSRWEYLTFHMNSVPKQPVILAPTVYQFVNTTHPFLVVENSNDPDRDSLYYLFKIYEDPGLTSLIDSSQAVPEEKNVTSWQVGNPLQFGKKYWWRVWATDEYELSEPSEISTFTPFHIRTFWSFAAYFTALLIVILRL